MNASINPTTRARVRYLWQLGVGTVVYIGLVFASRWAWHQVSSPWRVPVALVPMVALIFIFWAIVRYLRAMDEFQRQITINSLAIAGGAVGLLSASYGLLEGDPLPRPSAWWVYAVFMVGWTISSAFVCRRYQ